MITVCGAAKMPWDRSLYPANWEAIAYQVKAEAKWICAQCGCQCYRPGEAVVNRQFLLTVHHKDHDPANCSRDNLEALCCPCHLKKEHAYQKRLKIDWQVTSGQLLLPIREG